MYQARAECCVVPPATRVIIAAPDTLYRAAWAALLAPQPDIFVAGAIDDLFHPVSCIQADSPTAVLIAHSTLQPTLIHQLREICPQSGMLVLVPSYDLPSMLALLQAGATGCLAYGEPVGELVCALIAVGRGELVLPPALATRTLAALARGVPIQKSLGEQFSARESDVRHLLARGLTNKDIVQILILNVRMRYGGILVRFVYYANR